MGPSSPKSRQSSKSSRISSSNNDTPHSYEIRVLRVTVTFSVDGACVARRGALHGPFDDAQGRQLLDGELLDVVGSLDGQDTKLRVIFDTPRLDVSISKSSFMRISVDRMPGME